MKQREKNSVKFHVENDDLFGTIATTINLIKPCGDISKKAKKSIVKKLAHLQNNYRVVKK